LNNEVLGIEIVGWIAWATSILGVGVLAWGAVVAVYEVVRKKLALLGWA